MYIHAQRVTHQQQPVGSLPHTQNAYHRTIVLITMSYYRSVYKKNRHPKCIYVWVKKRETARVHLTHTLWPLSITIRNAVQQMVTTFKMISEGSDIVGGRKQGFCIRSGEKFTVRNYDFCTCTELALHFPIVHVYMYMHCRQPAKHCMSVVRLGKLTPTRLIATPIILSCIAHLHHQFPR